MLNWDKPFPSHMSAYDLVEALAKDLRDDPVTAERLSTEKGRLDMAMEMGGRNVIEKLDQWRRQK